MRTTQEFINCILAEAQKQTNKNSPCNKFSHQIIVVSNSAVLTWSPYLRDRGMFGSPGHQGSLVSCTPRPILCRNWTLICWYWRHRGQAESVELPRTHGRWHLGAGDWGVLVYRLDTLDNTLHNLKWGQMMIDSRNRIYGFILDQRMKVIIIPLLNDGKF